MIWLFYFIKPNDAVPSLQPHYNAFITTTDCSAPVPRFGTQTLTGPPLEFLPSHRDDRFSRSVSKPVLSSRHLYTGRHSDSKQVTFWIFPGIPLVSSFDDIYLLSIPQWWFAYARLLNPHLTHSLRLFLDAHYKGSLPMQLKVVWNLRLYADFEGPTLIFNTALLFRDSSFHYIRDTLAAFNQKGIFPLKGYIVKVLVFSLKHTVLTKNVLWIFI